MQQKKRDRENRIEIEMIESMMMTGRKRARARERTGGCAIVINGTYISSAARSYGGAATQQAGYQELPLVCFVFRTRADKKHH